MELYAVRDVGAVEAACALIQQVGRCGAPQFIRSDRGSQFVNETIEQLLKLVGTEHQLETQYDEDRLRRFSGRLIVPDVLLLVLLIQLA